MSDRLRNDVRPKAWIVIALGDEFSTYDDQTGDSYQYDSKVQNHKQVREGDLFFIRSRTGLQGAGQIKRIEMERHRRTSCAARNAENRFLQRRYDLAADRCAAALVTYLAPLKFTKWT